MSLEQTACEDLKAFERRLTEVIACLQPTTLRWRIVLVVISICTAIGAWYWLTDPHTSDVSFISSLLNHPFFSTSSLILLGIHKRVIAPSIITKRTRIVLTDFNMSCDDTGKLMEPISLDILEWYSKRFGTRMKTIDDIYEYGNSCMAKLLEVNVIKWTELHESAVWKLGIIPTMSEKELLNKRLEGRAKGNFKIFLERIKEKIESHNAKEISKDIVARGIGLCAAYTGKRAVFYVYSCSNNLEFIKINLMGSEEVEIESKHKNNRLMVSYIPPVKGVYLLYVSKNGWVAPGSPFEICVEDPPPTYTGNFGASEWYEDSKEASGETFEDMDSMPEIQICPSTPEFSIWSSMTEFGPPDCGRRRSVTYIAPDGATFPISIVSSEESFDRFDDLWFADSEFSPLSIEKKYFEHEFADETISSSIDNSKPFLEKNSISSEETVSEKIIEVIITRKKNSNQPNNDQNLKKSKSILSLFELSRFVRKTDIRRSKSALPIFKSIPCRNKKIFVNIEQYKTKEEIKTSQQVKQLKSFWNGVIEKRKEICPAILKHFQAKKNSKTSEPKVPDSSLSLDKERKKRFERARNLFSALEKGKETEKVKENKEKKKILNSFKRDLKNIFIDVEHGIGLPGVPNRLALLETLKSVDKRPSFAY